jgi:hypothetical protein
MSQIPDYPLKDEDGNPVLSRDSRFNHPWFTAKHLNVYDNDTADEIGWPERGKYADNPFPNVFFLYR